jgi:hemoglobin-like flavoprotein
MATVMEHSMVTPVGRDRSEEARPSRLPITLTDLITAIQDVVGPEDDGEVAAVSRVPWQEIAVLADVFRQQERNFLTPPLGKALEPDNAVDSSHESLIRQWRRLHD